MKTSEKGSLLATCNLITKIHRRNEFILFIVTFLKVVTWYERWMSSDGDDVMVGQLHFKLFNVDIPHNGKF